ncbi:Major facilitator Superfamily [Phytophthora cinnamomi]|uniref:Major facilitator Superfamily n=1 Tax=Phytophthora cinnamomi TaxID=4785 RepID=UPI00355A84BA|nr:Major facilitator Superfamily [Phytophthora cinnamomi]
MTASVRHETRGKGGYSPLLPRSPQKVPPGDSYKKWFMLAILSVLSAINQAICYSYAPIDSIVEARWHRRIRTEQLITIYFISYIPCSFIGSWLMDRFGLRFGVLLGGLLQAVGASLRYFACAFDAVDEVYVTVLGQVLASIAMPFMVNSPAVLSANWFPPSMRATSTSVAVNANAMGTALVYLIAPFAVFSSDEVPRPEWILVSMTTATFIVFCFFDGEHKRYAHESKVVTLHSEQEEVVIATD